MRLGQIDIMQNRKIRVVVDTNIWISFLIGKTIAGLSNAIINNSVQILFSEELFDELIEVLNRPKFRKYFSTEDIYELVSLINTKVEWIKITNHFNDCRDAKDNFLLDLIVSGKADYLVTGDDDLITLNPYKNVNILHYRDFTEILNEL